MVGGEKAIGDFRVKSNRVLDSDDKTVKLWNPNKGSLLKTYSGHGYEVLDVMGSCDNSQLVSCGLDKVMMIMMMLVMTVIYIL